MKIKFLIIFIIVVVFTFLLFKHERDIKIDEYLNQKTNQYEVMYKAIYAQFKQDSKIIHDHIMLEHQIVNIYKKINSTSNIKEINNLRKKLYLSHKSDYKYFKQYKVKQLHFHLSNNHSFLRMHKPSKHSDDLTNFRETVEYVNKNKTPIDGFENGKVYSGFRFVYPITDEEGTHLGTMEVSFDVSAFTSKFMEYYNVLCNFHIDKKITDTKVWNEFKSKNFIQSPFEDFYLEKNTLNEIKRFSKSFNLDKQKMKSISAKNIGIENIKNKKAITAYDETIDKVITFIPILNPVTKEVNAFFTIRSDSKYINNKTLNFYFIFTIIITFTIIVLSLIYQIITSKDNLNLLLNDMVNKKTNEIHNLNKNLEKTVLIRTNELELSKDKMKNYVDLIDTNIITSSTDLKGNIIGVSQAFCNISGYSKDQLIGKPHSIVKHPDTPIEVFNQIWDACNNDKIWKGEIKNQKKDGTFYWVTASIHPIYNTDNQKIGYTSIRQDITDKKMIEQISITDGLTGIFNRRYFNQHLPKVISSAKRDDEIVCLLIMDIDYFKQYNDTYGHQMGDEALIKVAKSINSSLNRVSDSCFRLGGEEFGIIFKCKNNDQSLIFANKIKNNIENLKISHKKNSVSDYITVSIGLVCKNAHDIKDVDTIYKETDDLLYHAKNNGRNRISI